MRATKIERVRAEQVSKAIDSLIRDDETATEQLVLDDTGVLPTVRQLAQLPSLLGPVDSVLEQRIMSQVRAGPQSGRRAFCFRPTWVVAGLAAVLLLAALLTPLGQTAVASFMAVFNLGRTEVRITPVDAPAAVSTSAVAKSTAVTQELTLAKAQVQFPFSIQQPTYLPPGYSLRGVTSYSYPDLPAWVPQPFFVDLVYGHDSGQVCTLRLYPITLGDRASISGLNLEAAPIQEVQDVEVNGEPAVLLRLGTEEDGAAWQEVVWEQDDLILALSATDLTEEDLLRIARSIQRENKE